MKLDVFYPAWQSLFSMEAFIVFVFDNGYQYGWLSLLIYCSHVKLITFLL